MASFLSHFQSFYKDLMINTIEESMVESLILEVPILVNYNSYAVDGYMIAFDSENPKYENFVCDIQDNDPVTVQSTFAGASLKGLWFNKL